MSTPPPFRERLSWQAQPGRIMDGAVRYMMIRPDALMDAIMRCPPEARREMLNALFCAVRDFGGRSAANYNRTATRPLIEVVAQTAPDLGWGRWHIEQGENALHITVEDSPFTETPGPADMAMCSPMVGMMSAVGHIMSGQEVTAVETCCAARDGGNACHFIIPVKDPA